MRIAIDARELHGKPTGVGRYLGELLRVWGDLPEASGHDIVLCAPDPFSPPDAQGLRLSTSTRPGHGTRWEQFVLPALIKASKADVLFAPAYTGPLRCPAPCVVTVHDVSFAAHPEWFSRREGLRRRVLTRLTARRAARVITVSEFSKAEIVKYFGIDPARIDVIYHGAPRPAGLAPPAPDPHAEAPVVLYVGSVFERRHLPELIQGFARLWRRRSDVRLEVVGDNRTRPPIDLAALTRAAGTGDAVRLRSYVADDELRTLYRRARAFAFLSDYEGFGLTPLEALAAGVPVVVLDTAVTREVYGEAAFYVPQPAPAMIEAALERVLFDQQLRDRLLDAAEDVLARYSWYDCARRVLDVLVACSRRAG